jgi:hypothetical protein
MKTKKPGCYGSFPHEIPPMMEDCYKNCKGSIILCKQATREKEQAKITKFDRWVQCRSCGEQVHLLVWGDNIGKDKTILVSVVQDNPKEEEQK